MAVVSVSFETNTTGPTGSSRRINRWYTNRADVGTIVRRQLPR
jgi:hypothetical protein